MASSSTHKGIRKRDIARYVLLPGLVPRVKDFWATGFSLIAMFMAHAYFAVRLLPRNHPYLDYKNKGRYGIRSVVAEARRHLVFKRENLDQIVIYYALLIGLLLLAVQGLVVIVSIIPDNAFAQEFQAALTSIFVTENPSDDVAFRLLDLVFGLEGIFESNIADDPNWPGAVHEGLHAIFHFYNVGIFAVGLIIFLYMITTIVGEMAQTGSPFGRRFNGAMAPIRLILAIGLLIPFASGFNGAQLMTLNVAKWGSGMATNGWITFNESVRCAAAGEGACDDGRTPLGVPSYLVGVTKSPTFDNFLQFMFIAHTCKYAEEWINRRNDTRPEEGDIYAYLVHEDESWPVEFIEGDSGLGEEAVLYYQDALEKSANGDLKISIGVKDEQYSSYEGNVRPVCGKIRMPVKGVTAGSEAIHEGYFELLLFMLYDPFFTDHGKHVAMKMTPTLNKRPTSNYFIPTSEDLMVDYILYYASSLPVILAGARQAQIDSEEWFDDITGRGWGAAGTWYNTIAELNGGMVASSLSLPYSTGYPEVMEYVLERKSNENTAIDGNDRFNPYLSNGNLIDFLRPGDAYVAMALYYASLFWKDTQPDDTDSPFASIIKSVFGLEGLYDMYENKGIHPLAQLVGVGRSLIESTIRNLGIAFGGGIAGGLASILSRVPGNEGLGEIGGLATQWAGVAKSIAIIGLSIGFVLYYVIPFLPFAYFFLALGGWVKGIFEAMVGLPLWALAHIRIDGEGIPGPSGMDGYYLIFEIMIRPFLIICSLIASVVIFGAQTSVLHSIWGLVTQNVSGHGSIRTTYELSEDDIGELQAIFDGDPTSTDPESTLNLVVEEVGELTQYFRGEADQLFYMVMYTIVVYLMALASFKLIDFIPNNILRWMGAKVGTFAEQTTDPAAQLTRNVYYGSDTAIQSFDNTGSTISRLLGT